LYPDVEFPAFVEDGALALAWLAANVPQSRHGLVVLGHSAGAHIAALLALDPRYRESVAVSAPVRGLVGLAGPYAFQPLDYASVRPIFDDAADVDDARPVTFACRSTVPRLLLHGDADTVVVPANSRALHKRSADCAVPSRYRSLDGVNHYEILLGLSSTFQQRGPVVEEIMAFLAGLD
jgi:acetyl esterase/lipase